MKKRFIHPKTVLRTVLAVVLAACLVCSVPVAPASALTVPDSFDDFRASLLTNANQVDRLYLADYNHMPFHTILAHNNNSVDVTQWQAQYADTSSKRIALTEGYLYDLCAQAYLGATGDPFVLKSIQARQACWLETLAQLEGVTAAAYAVMTIDNMTDPEFTAFRSGLSQCNGFPEHIKAVVMNYRTLNASVEEFLFAAAAIDELYVTLEEIGQTLHRAGSTSANPDYEAAALLIEQYTDYAQGNYNNFVSVVQTIITTPNFDPAAAGITVLNQVWGNVSSDLVAAQIITAPPGGTGMYGQTAVSGDPLLDAYDELRVLADFNDALRQVTEVDAAAAHTPPVDAVAYSSFKTLLASGALTGNLTAYFAANAANSGLFISVVQDDPVKQQVFLDRLNEIASTYAFLVKGIDRARFNDYLTDSCADASAYLNIQPEPPGPYDNLEGQIEAIVTDMMTTANTTGDVVIDRETVCFEDYDVFGDLYVQDNLTVYLCNPIIEGSVYQTDGFLEPMDGSLTICGHYEITQQGTLHLLRPNDFVKVEGKFLMDSNVSHAGLLTDGVLSVGGNFAQGGDTCSFQTSGNHKTILFGSTTQHVSFNSTDSGFTQLELQNDDIVFDTPLRSLTLCCDLTVRNDWNWQNGILDLNGFTLNELGDFTVSDGELQLNNGTLNVGGNLTVTGTGSLPMTNPADRVNVGGNFLTDTMTNHGGRLTHGVMTVKGNFTQMGDPQSFAASNDHQVILDGPTPVQHVTFTNVSSQFNRLTLMNDYPADYTFDPAVCWNQLEVVTTVSSVSLNPPYPNLPRNGYMALNPSVSGHNLTSPAPHFTLTLADNTGSGTYIDNDNVLYIDSNEQAQAVTITITSTDDPGVSASLQVGIIAFSSCAPGDLNFDGGLTINDATLLQQNLAEFIDFMSVQDTLADFNNDGRVNVRDVTAIQRRLAGLG